MSVKFEETFREALPEHFLFKFESFSLLSKNGIEKYESNEFETGGYKWNIKIYPRGLPEGRNRSIALYLRLADSTDFTHALKVYTKFKLRVTNLGFIVFRDMHEAKHWFCASSQECGWDENMKLEDVLNDTVMVEAEISVISFIQKLP